MNSRRGMPSRFSKRGAAFARFQAHRVTFLSDLADTLTTGANVVQAVRESAQRCEDKLLRGVYVQIRDELGAGRTFAVAVGAWFTPTERMLLESFLEGARTNEQLGQALLNLGKVVGPFKSIRDALLTTGIAAVAAFVGILLALAISGGALIYLEGQLPTKDWPTLIVAFVAAVKWIGANILLVAGLVIALPFVVFRLLGLWSGPLRRRWDKSVFGFRAYRETYGALVMISLGAFSAAGRGIGETCKELMLNASPWLRWYIAEIRKRAADQEGANIVDVGLFQWQLMVRVGCLCSGVPLPDALRTVGLDASDLIAKRLVERLGRAQKILFATIPVAMFLCVGVIAVMYSFILSSAGSRVSPFSQ